MRFLGVRERFNLRNAGRNLVLHFYTLRSTHRLQITTCTGSAYIQVSIVVTRTTFTALRTNDLREGHSGMGDKEIWLPLSVNIYQSTLFKARMSFHRSGHVVDGKPHRFGVILAQIRGTAKGLLKRHVESNKRKHLVISGWIQFHE